MPPLPAQMPLSAKTLLFGLDDDLADWFPPYGEPADPPLPPPETATSLQMSDFTHVTFVDPMLYINLVQECFQTDAHLEPLKDRQLVGVRNDLRWGATAFDVCDQLFDPAHPFVFHLLRRHPTQPIPSVVKHSWQDTGLWELKRAVYSLVALHDPAEILPRSFPLSTRRRRRFAMIEVRPFGTFDALVSDLRKVEEKNKNKNENNHDEGTSIVGPDVSRLQPTTQKWLKHIADTCLSLRINHAAITDHVHLIMFVFPAMNISQDSSSTPGQLPSPGAHGGTFSVSIVKRSREKPVAYAGWLRAAACDTPFDA
ncbi:hypothetical protein CPAR01_14887 [Colletotrichum paranaense]|uniref:Uncharacterized protein n=1 Tax=Colletotrichum paranaense TaxID=1914294 RepID=A0ABQ9S075_9PEZI|nr:uncharacterized protein CPAR01_14887 [Colletotrichum paranaense]KAK1521364.1 hypothetical protein CPAR01_14887 [Colletotrichum paranaense]